MGFQDFLGNPQAVAALREMLARDGVPGSLLFAGPDGVGKKTLATMLARALNCERLKDDFCGECFRCRKAEEMLALTREDLARRRDIKDTSRRVEGLTYFDIQLIEPITRYILIEQIRQLRSTAYTRPFELPRRVFILDQAQAIHWQAIDLLLKVMEEPPETTHFILVCPNPHELRTTLRSRCLKVQLRPVEDAVIQSVLKTERKIPERSLTLATRAVSGSVARAKRFELADFERSRQPWVAFLDGIASKDPSALTAADWKSLFEATKTLGENRSELEQTLQMGYALLRDTLLMLKNGHEPSLMNIDLIPRLKTWGAKLGLEGLEKLKRGLDEAYRLQTRNVNQQLGWEALAVEIISSRRATI
jgi:DNA polymerase-3 subunit delta'